MRISLAFAVICLLAVPGRAQAALGWEAYPAFTEVTAVASAPDGLWAASDGGVFFYDTASGELRTATAATGLRGGAVGAVAVDDARGALWIGYRDGVLERLDAETLEARAFFEIRRADQYPARGVRRIVVRGDVLYVATDFGVVVFDAAGERVQNAYARFADQEAGTPVNDVLDAPLPTGEPGLWVATDGGVFTASRDADNLQAPGSWTRETGFEGAALSIAAFDRTVYVGGGVDGVRDLYRRSASGTYDRQLFINNPITSLAGTPERLYASAPSFVYAILPPGQPSSFYRIAGSSALTGGTVGPDEQPDVRVRVAADLVVGGADEPGNPGRAPVRGLGDCPEVACGVLYQLADDVAGKRPCVERLAAPRPHGVAIPAAQTLARGEPEEPSPVLQHFVDRRLREARLDGRGPFEQGGAGLRAAGAGQRGEEEK